jgi:hypothetical protein
MLLAKEKLVNPNFLRIVFAPYIGSTVGNPLL